MPPDPSAVTFRHVEAALHLARCAEAVLARSVVERRARSCGAGVLVERDAVVALREALQRMQAVWQLEEEA